MSVDYQDFKIFFTVFLLWISIQFGEVVEDSIAYIMVLSLGIVHGANDLVILKKRVKNNSSFLRSVLGYIVLILICILSFFINPFISLLLFIGISAYHFGEQHFEHKIEGPNWIKLALYSMYGVLIFLMIFYENMTDVDVIVSDLTGSYFSKRLIFIGLILCSSILLLLFLFGKLKKYTFSFNPIKELFYLFVLYLVFKTSSLILGFAIYFIFWHSIPSIIDQTKYISGKVNKGSFLNYFKTASLIWVVSIGGLIGLYFLLEESLFSSAIFLILFAVTAPHAWVMYRMKKTSE